MNKTMSDWKETRMNAARVAKLKAQLQERGVTLVEKFTVKRGRWLRGFTTEGTLDDSGLLMDSGKMCCMGQLLQASGAKDSDLLGVPTVEDFARYSGLELPGDDDVLRPIYLANDTCGMDRRTRERRVRKAVKQMLGIDVTFED